MSVMQKRFENGMRIGVLCGCLLPLVGCSSQVTTQADCADLAPGVSDPAEGLNRKVFAFNRVVDDYALAPWHGAMRGCRSRCATACTTSPPTSPNPRCW